MTKYINTLKDLEAATYGNFGNNSIIKGAGLVGGLHTGHDDSTALNGTAAPGLNLYNVIYGQKVWSMLNQEINPLSVLPKRPYTSSGWRVMTQRPLGGSNPAFGIGTDGYSGTTKEAFGSTSATSTDAPGADLIGGVDENHALEGVGLQALAPEYTTLYMSPKTIAHMFSYSELAAEMAKIDDGVGDIRAIIREDMGKFHAEVQSKMLVMDLSHYDHATANQYTNMERNYTSLNKIVASALELQALKGASLINGTVGSLPDQIAKLYSNDDRDTSSGVTAGFMDATVNYGAGYGSSQVRALTTTLLNTLIQDLRTNGGTPKVILTGYDTIQTIADLLQSQERFLERKEIIPTHNGVKGVKGREVGFRVATYFDIPLIPCKDMPNTGAATTQVSDLLFLDTDHLWLAVMKPTQYFEDGINHGNPFGVGTLGNRGMFRTMGETGCTFFKGQGKLTNVQ
jgi:hypothetical protein